MPSEETLLSVLNTAVFAPSGDNAQPWEFELKEGEIRIFNKPSADTTLYNFKQRGSYVAHGALIENITLLAAQQGIAASVELFPEGGNCVARVVFVPTISRNEALCDYIKQRATNRKPYRATPLQEPHRTALVRAVRESDVTLHLVEERQLVEKFGKVLSLNERLLMENRPLHDFLFGMIRWSKEEELERPGLYIKTMELPPPVQFMFAHVLRHWGLLRVLNRIGLSRGIAAQTAKLYAASSAIGILEIPSEDDAQFVAAGRALQRLWLTAAQCGLSLQPTTALPYLQQRVREGQTSAFSPAHIEEITEAGGQIEQLASLKPDSRIAMIFRVGYDGSPTAQSHKLPPMLRRASA